MVSSTLYTNTCISPDLGTLKVDGWTDSRYPLCRNGFRRPPKGLRGWTKLDGVDGFRLFGGTQLYTPPARFTPSP